MNEYKIRFNLKSNLHIGSGFSFMRLIDKTTVKDRDGCVFIPGSTIKGKLRSVCKKICLSLDGEFGAICQGKDSLMICKTSLDNACIICRLFGSAYNEGKLIFHDAFLLPDDREMITIMKSIDPFIYIQSEYRSRNKISRYLRTSSPKQLYTSESCPSKLVFEGKMCSGFDLTKDEKQLLCWGAKSILHLGGQKGQGLGRLTLSIEGI